MKKKLISLIAFALALVMAMTSLPVGAAALVRKTDESYNNEHINSVSHVSQNETHEKAQTSEYPPYARIEYSYSSSVVCGTIRYISQMPDNQYFDSRYWPANSFGNYSTPKLECGTSCISMAHSYIGINNTPNDILVAHDGSTWFSGWPGTTHSTPSLATGLSNYLNGNGKYSPLVVKLPNGGSGSNDHYILIMAKISDTTVQILDPARDAIQTGTINGSKLNYRGTNYTVTVHQWYNENAYGSNSYLSQCTQYPCYANVAAKASSKLWTLPCSDSTNSSSQNPVNVSSSGETLVATRLFKNTANNYWYRVTKNGSTYYLYAGNVNSVTRKWDTTITGVSVPTNLTQGSSFSIGGTIKTDNLQLTYVSSYVYPGSSTSGTASTGTYEDISASSYSLKSSKLDSGTKFGSLSNGTYTIVFSAKTRNYYSTNGTSLQNEVKSSTLHTSQFTVGAPAPTPTPKPTYTVTFKDWNGTVLKTQTVTHGGAATAPANPTRTGYTFTGWDRSFNNVTSNLTVNAVYSINTYTVTFKNWDGTTLKTQTVNYGGAATAPADPTRPGYSFVGWDKAFNNITSNLTVNAVFSIPKMNGTSPVDLGAEFYAYIINPPTGKYLTNNQPYIKGEAASENYNQIWKFRRQENNAYAIFSTLNDACLDVQSAGLEGGTKLIAYTGGYSGGLNQKFYIYNTFGSYFLSPVHSSGRMFVDMDQNNYNVTIWGGGQDHPQHRFSIIKVEPINGNLPVSHTVTFKDWDGTVLKTQTVSYGCAATAPANPSRPGYDFTGWDKTFNNVTTDLIVTAQYSNEYYPAKPIVTVQATNGVCGAIPGWATVVLNWNNCGSNATSYHVRVYYEDGTHEFAASVNTTYHCFELQPGTYRFTVAAVNDLDSSRYYTFSDYTESVTVNQYAWSIYGEKIIYNEHTYVRLNDLMSADWNQAEQLCEMLGGHLPTITSAEENEIVKNLANNGASTYTWLGANDHMDESTWSWVTGETFEYSNWSDGEPNDINNNEDFLELYADGKWNDNRNGNYMRNIIIEFDYIANTFPAEALKTGTFNGHIYTLYKQTMFDWNEAEAFCESQGGKLVCINTSDEQIFIESFTNDHMLGSVFIGATDAETEGVWKWVSGEAMTYSNWNAGEPNGGTYENCSVAYCSSYVKGKWNDSVIDRVAYVIMEKEEEPPATEPPTNPPVTEPPVTPDPSAPQIVVSSATALAGNTVTVDVSLANNPGIVSMALNVDFDERLTLTSVTDSGLLPGQVHSPTMGNPYTLFWSNDTALENYVVNGVLATLTFEIPEDMPVGEYPITISYDLDNYDIYNCDVETVEFAVVNGSVNVIDVLIGDVNTDTKVNNLDKLVFTRFLAKWADYPESVINMIAADVNLDTKVNNLDKLILTRHLAKWVGYETLPYTAKSAPEAKLAEIKGDEPTIIVDSVTAEPGETVTVNVSLANNPGIVSMSLTMAFDPMLELVAVNDTGLLPGKVHSPTLGNPYTLFWANDTALENYVVNGSLVQLSFKLSENAEPGTYPITITYDLDNYDIYNCDVELVEFAVVNGGVTYEPEEPTTHTVTFIDPITGEVIAAVEVEHGEAAEAPEAPAHAWYTFTGWDADFSAVTEDITVTAQYTELGDVDGNGTVEMSDALQLMRWLIGSDEIACDEAEADFNSDGKTDLMDALLLMRHILGTI